MQALLVVLVLPLPNEGWGVYIMRSGFLAGCSSDNMYVQ